MNKTTKLLLAGLTITAGAIAYKKYLSYKPSEVEPEVHSHKKRHLTSAFSKKKEMLGSSHE